MVNLADRVLYGASQSARVAWFFGHYIATVRNMTPAVKPGHVPPRPAGTVPNRMELLAKTRALFVRDWHNIDAGLYLAPEIDHLGWLLNGSRDYFRDLRAVDRRRAGRINDEVPADMALPRYYRQNFHYQTDGWLSRESAERYDFQVETLFTGAADAMRRQALPPIREIIADRSQRRMSLVDIACGNGRFLAEVKRNYPALRTTGVDLSHPYLATAADRLRSHRASHFVLANAETMPFADDSQDIVTSVYLFHELPPKVRAIVAAEIARVLKPGGRAVIVDSVQQGDDPDFDGMLGYFPLQFHEPYYESYTRTNMNALFTAGGLTATASSVALFSKVMVYDKPV